MPTRTLRADVPKHDPDTPIVFVVDDDDLMRKALQRILVNAGFAVELYAAGAEFLAEAKLDRHGCLLLDVAMPGMNGLEVQRRLNQARSGLPVIFLTGSSHIADAVAAMREGALDFIEKPFENDDVLDRVRKAIVRNDHERRDAGNKQLTLQRLGTLTPREREVLEQVVAGKTNKEIARVLTMSHRTVEIHRARIMEKMSAPTLADLVRMRLLSAEES